MYGAILGDMIGSPYEFKKGSKRKDFPFFDIGARFTDDTVMSIAVAEALMNARSTGVIDDEAATKEITVDMMHKWGSRYPHAGYGGRFRDWLRNGEREPYNSWGNGSAMRVSAAGWMFEDIGTTRRMARWTAEVTHNHPEGIKGAEAVASAIYLARNSAGKDSAGKDGDVKAGSSKDDIRTYIETEFGYDLSRSVEEIKWDYDFDVSCQGSVPQAIRAFLDGEDFEDVIRTAISLGGDTDTIGAMAGSIAEAFYGVPDQLKEECVRRLPGDLAEVLKQFEATL